MTRLVLQLIGLTAYTSPFKSSKYPEPKNIDQTHQVDIDLTRPSVRSALLLSACAHEADVSVHHAPPETALVHSIVPSRSSIKSDLTRRSRQDQRLIMPPRPLLLYTN
jgi:hypothetical protein